MLYPLCASTQVDLGPGEADAGGTGPSELQAGAGGAPNKEVRGGRLCGGNS
jgi:hypothetical protein